MRALKSLFYLLVLVAVVLIGGSFILPTVSVVTRSIEIDAPPDKVFALVGDYRRFNEFSPWADLDPDTAYTFGGPEIGIGQKMSWSSNDSRVGTGSQTITDYKPPTHVTSELDFAGMGQSTATWDLIPSGGGTRVTWGFRGHLDGIAARWSGLMLDKWIGDDYRKGLARLKVLAERQP